MAEVRTAHFTLTFEGQPPPTALGFQLTSAEGDTAAPDKLKAKLKARFGPNPVESELVVLGSEKLLKNPLSGRFEALTLPLGSLALLDKDRGVPNLLRTAKDPVLASQESVDGTEADVLTGNIRRFLDGEELDATFDGHANCFVETGFHKALLIDFNYEVEPLPGRYPTSAGPLPLLRESRLNHMAKLAFQSLYWHMLLPGREIPGISTELQMHGKKTPVEAGGRKE